MDSQSVKSTSVGGEERGYDGGKKVKGRKRHLLVDTVVDTEGFVLRAKVHSAKVMDHEGVKELLGKADIESSHASNTYGWMLVTEVNPRARIGSKRYSGGVWRWSNTRASPLPKRH